MLDYKVNGKAAELRSKEGELIEFINYDDVFSMFIVDKYNNTATMTINREEMKQVYSAIGSFLQEEK